MRNANRPRFNRCDSCGRNAHKVVVRTKATGVVHGVCPSCWEGDTVGRPAHWPPFNWDAVTVLADNRAKRPAGTTPPSQEA
jgi:hypothetical protein